MSMTPNFKSKDYIKHEHQIKLVRDINEGVDEAKAHLQQFGLEDDSAFTKRKAVATLDNFIKSTLETMQNIVFRKPLSIEGIKSATLLEYIKKIDFKNNLNTFSKNLLYNRLMDGKTYIMVDSVGYDTDKIKTDAQRKQANIRPYLVNILRENILWKDENDTGGFSAIAIRSFVDVKVGKFGSDTKEITKVYYDTGLVETYDDKDIHLAALDKQRSFTGIPIVEIGDDDTPPLYDLAKINVSHLNRNNEFDYYVRVGAVPFPKVWGDLKGVDEDNKTPKTLGIDSGLHFDGNKNEADFEWAEMSGKNATIIKERIADYVDQMIRIAIEFTTESNNKTATQVEKESMSGEAKLTHYSTETEEAINTALGMMNLFEDSLGENTILMNKDFNNAILTPEQANSYRMDYMQNIISLERLWSLLERGEYLPTLDEKEREAEKLLIKDGANSIEE